MTAAVLERDHISWKPHAHIDKFRATDEREAAFTLFPRRARALEKMGLISKGEHGGLERSPLLAKAHELPRKAGLDKVEALLIPHITADMLLKVGADVIGTVDEPGNLLLNAGINRMGSLLIGGGGQVYNNTNTAIGVGDTATAAAATQTDLSAAVNAANRYFQMADATYPTFATQVLTVVATFASGNANFAWNEWMIDQHTASGATAAVAAALNRKVVSLGTKTSAAAWAFTVTITIS